MSTLFAFLHHVSAFTLVSALAIEFALIRQELTPSSARRLQVTDLVLGIAAGALAVIGCCACSSSRRARTIISTAMPS
jgi:putative membrane protein